MKQIHKSPLKNTLHIRIIYNIIVRVAKHGAVDASRCMSDTGLRPRRL